MKKNGFLAGMLSAALALGMVFVGCSDDGGGDEPAGDNGIEKILTITGLPDEYSGVGCEVGIANTIDDLLKDQNLIAYSRYASVSGTTLTVPLLNDYTMKPWTGTGSYYVGVNTNADTRFATRSKIKFTDAVTTVPYSSFEEE